MYLCNYFHPYSAVTEDANRAIELKSGSTVGGRKIVVMHAMHRAPLEQRRSGIKQGLYSNLCNQGLFKDGLQYCIWRFKTIMMHVFIMLLWYRN